MFRIKYDGVRLSRQDWVENWRISRMRSYEVHKFKDLRRVAIASQFPLSKEQKEQIDDLYLSFYGEKIDYVWHQNYAAHAGQFDYRFIPELIYIPEFETFMNQNIAAKEIMSDKNFLPLLAKSVNVKMPKTIVSCTNGIFRDGENCLIDVQKATKLLKESGRFFIKPSVDSSSGQGCMKVEEHDVFHFNQGSLYFDNLYKRRYSKNFVCQEIVTCHNSISQIYSGSVNTFRVISYLWRDKIEMMPIIIRIGQGGNYLDNAHAGGMFCAVYDDGSMGSHAVTEDNVQFKEHPDSHVIFSNHKIDNLDKVIDAAKRMHSLIPQIGVVNWDFTINEEGEALLIEANVKNGSIWLPQMAHGTGAFGERTEEVLQWLRFMKKLKPHERHLYVAGRMK